MNQIEKELVRCVLRVKKTSAPVGMKTDLVKDLNFTSLDFIDFSFELEKQFRSPLDLLILRAKNPLSLPLSDILALIMKTPKQ